MRNGLRLSLPRRATAPFWMEFRGVGSRVRGRVRGCDGDGSGGAGWRGGIGSLELGCGVGVSGGALARLAGNRAPAQDPHEVRRAVDLPRRASCGDGPDLVEDVE